MGQNMLLYCFKHHHEVQQNRDALIRSHRARKKMLDIATAEVVKTDKV